MQIFLDSTDTAEIAALAETGLVDGVTTNPSLIAKSGRIPCSRSSALRFAAPSRDR